MKKNKKVIKILALLLFGIIIIPFGILNDINERSKEHESINKFIQKEQQWDKLSLKSKIKFITHVIIGRSS